MSMPAGDVTGLELSELGTPELLLVTSLRLYALPFRTPHRHHLDWRGGFGAAGIGDVAVPNFAALFGIVSRTALRPLAIGCPHCRRLGFDESLYLRLIALKQRSRWQEAATILREWTPPAAARMAAMPVLGLAYALERGRLIVPLREGGAGGRSAVMALLDPGLALLQ
jgi:hypothetical protein